MIKVDIVQCRKGVSFRLVTTMLGLTLREDGLSGVERIGRTK